MVVKMPIFDYKCPNCGFINELLIVSKDRQPRGCQCVACKALINTEPGNRLPGAPSFKIKGLRAANGYGLKFVDSYGKSKTDGHESGYSFTSNKAETTDHNQGQERKN